MCVRYTFSFFFVRSSNIHHILGYRKKELSSAAACHHA